MITIFKEERASIEEIHPAHLDHVIKIIVIEAGVRRNTIDLNGRRQETRQYSSDQPWSTHDSLGNPDIKLECRYA